MSMADHVASLCRSCFFQLRQLRLVRSSLTDDSAKTLVHTFISIRLAYCNSVLYGVSGRLLRKLQTVQNAAARVVTRPRKFDHITPVLNELRCMAAHGTACAVQAGADCFQVPPWPGTVLPHRRLRLCVVRGWSTSAAVRRHQNPVRSTDSY